MKQFTDFKTTLKKAIPPTIVATVIFFITYFLFGSENSMIGPFATLSFLRFRSMYNHFECMIRNFLIYLAMAVLAALAVVNLPLCILVNALALVWIAGILIDEYNPTNYFPAGMSLIFFQIAPVTTVPALGNRIAALLVTFVIVFVFIGILSKVEKKEDPLPQLFRKGFENCAEQLRLARMGDAPEAELDALHRQLCDINKSCSGEIYAYNRAALRRAGRTNWYCQFILVFQIINYLTLHRDTPENMEKAEALYARYHEQLQTVSPEVKYLRFHFRDTRPDLKNFRIRFALRQLIVLTPCLVFAWYTHLPNAYWLVISVFFMMIPFSDQTRQRVKQRVLGTIAGIIICLLLFSVFQNFPARVIIMTIANFLIYGASGYGATVAYITCSALALQTLNSTISLVLLQRLLYTLIGAVIAVIANRWIFPIRVRKQVDYLMELIRTLQTEMIRIAETTRPGDDMRRKELDQRTVKIYLLSKRLETLCQSQPDSDIPADYPAFQKEHMTFLAEYLFRYML